MLAQIRLFDSGFLASLLDEFRASMRGLLFDLCDELKTSYRSSAESHRLPVSLFQAVGAGLKLDDYSNWKVVGWIEELNDLLYFLDVYEQLSRERDRSGFAEELLAECEEQFYEHTYLDELFPHGEPEPHRLAGRLVHLCRRLARHVTQDSMFLIPGLPCDWLARDGKQRWSCPYEFGPNFERSEPAGYLPVGLEGAGLAPAPSIRRRLRERKHMATMVVEPRRIALRLGTAVFPLLSYQPHLRWHWRYVQPAWLRAPGDDWPDGLALGSTLVYGRERTPVGVTASPPDLSDRFTRALTVIEAAWPEGAENLKRLTTRIVPLKARGVVSFSYRHRPGLSFINCFDRDGLDLIDDLIHENSHHHLNLLLRKAVLYQGDANQEIFYSPWRRSLRPLRGILHATFTFTMGAVLFERLSSNADRLKPWLSKAEVLRARARCLEEIASVHYSLDDLDWAAERGWLTAAGVQLVATLKREIRKIAKRIVPYESEVNRSRYGRELRRHINELARAGRMYRPASRKEQKR